MMRFLSTPKLFIALLAAALSICTAPASAGGFKDQGANPSWGGLYIAGSVGYSFGTAKDTLALTGFPTTRDNVDIDGFTGTAAIGYDYMLTPQVLVGLFADYTFGELDGSGSRVYPAPTPAVPFDVSIDKMWSVGARVGLVRSGDSLWYLMAGYTQAELEYSDFSDSGEFDLKGYFLGAGFERMLRDRWFLRAEYRFSDFGKETIFAGVCAVACGGGEERERIDTKIHAVRLGIVYKLTEDPAPAYQPYK